MGLPDFLGDPGGLECCVGGHLGRCGSFDEVLQDFEAGFLAPLGEAEVREGGGGVVAVGVVFFVLEDFFVILLGFEGVSGGFETPGREVGGGEADAGIGGLFFGEFEPACGLPEFFLPEFQGAEAVGARGGKLAGLEFQEQALVARPGGGCVAEDAVGFRQPEERGVAARLCAIGGEERFVFRNRGIVHLARVESIGPLERRGGGVLRNGGRQTDAAGLGVFGWLRRGFELIWSWLGRWGGRWQRGWFGKSLGGWRGLGSHGFRPQDHGFTGRQGAPDLGFRANRQGAADFLGVCGGCGERQQRRGGRAFHSGRLVAKATFQMFACLQMSRTSTTWR